MPNLRYVKIFDSSCPRQCVGCKVNLPEGLEFPLKEIRYFHWLNLPLDELPIDFNPENLIDLRLPYSKIQRLWRRSKVCLPVSSFITRIHLLLYLTKWQK